MPNRTTSSRDDALAALLGLLAEGVDVHRCLAARALGRIRAAETVPALIAALLDEDEDVRTDAADALAAIGDERAGEQLLENLLGDPCAEVKLAAVDALRRMRHEDAIPWLRRLVRGRDPEIVWDEEELFQAEWDSWLDLQVKAIAALGEFGATEAVADIDAAIEDEEGQDVTGPAFDALARLGEPGAEMLELYFDGSPPEIRRRIATVAVRLEPADADDLIAKALGDESTEVVFAVARALAEQDRADDRLVDLFDSENPALRAEAATLIGELHLDRVADLLEDPVAAVRQTALRVFADHGSTGGVRAALKRIEAALDDPEAGVAAAAAFALAAVAPDRAAGVLGERCGDEACPPVLRIAAVRALTDCGDVACVDNLAYLVGDDNRQFRLESLVALAAIAARLDTDDNAALDTLLAALSGELLPEPEPEDEDADAPESVEDGPAPMDDEPARPEEEDGFPTSTLDALTQANAGEDGEGDGIEFVADLSEEDHEFLGLAASERGKRRMQIAPKIPAHEDVPRLAARILGDVHQARVADALATALDGPDMKTRSGAADSLARLAEAGGALPESALAALRAQSVQGSGEARLASIRALGLAGDADATMALISSLEDEDAMVRAEALAALARMNETGAGVERFLDDPDAAVRLAACRALLAADGARWLDRAVDFAFAHEGYHGRAVARLLRPLDTDRANAGFLAVLSDDDRRREWSVAIEALEELYAAPDASSPAAV